MAPMRVSPEEVAATEVPPYLGAPVLTAAAVLVVCIDLNVCAAFDQHLDRIGVIPGASVYPLVWNILLAARNEGYGGVLTTMAVAEEPRVKELLGIPDDYAIAALLPIGKPVKQVKKLTRKPVSELAVRERFDGDAALAPTSSLPWREPSPCRTPALRAAFIFFLYDRTFSSDPASTMSATERCEPALP